MKVKKFISALATTIGSAVLVAVLYVIYLPFGIGRSIFSRELISDFMYDALTLIEEAPKRFRKWKYKK